MVLPQASPHHMYILILINIDKYFTKIVYWLLNHSNDIGILDTFEYKQTVKWHREMPWTSS